MKSLFLFIFALFAITSVAIADDVKDQKVSRILDLSLEELGNIRYSSAAVLTPTSQGNVPATVTIITHEMIQNSGASGLYELLRIYVPELQTTVGGTHNDGFGIRGLNTVANERVLLMVNGYILNERLRLGITNNEYPLLNDIESIEVISGAGSAILGPGAISGIISIKTFNGNNFNGFEVAFDQGVVFDYSALQLKYGHEFDNDSNIFIYYGIDKVNGADPDDASTILRKPVVFPSSPEGTTRDTDYKPNYRDAYKDKPHHRFHIQYEKSGEKYDFSSWFRFVRAGNKLPYVQGNYLSVHPTFTGDNFRQRGYQTIAWNNTYRRVLTDNLNLKINVGLDLQESEQRRGKYRNPNPSILSTREDELFSQASLNYKKQNHKLALGAEYRFEQFGRKPKRFDGSDDVSHVPEVENAVGEVDPWDVGTYGVFAEHQWHFSKKWTSFVSARVDKHTYTKFMISPRLGVVYNHDENNIFKVIYNRSVKKTNDASLRRAQLLSGKKGEEEDLDQFEFIYNHKWGNGFTFDINTYYSKFKLINWDANSQTFGPAGKVTMLGITPKIKYTSDKLVFSLAHAYSPTINFQLPHGVEETFISAEPFGGGKHQRQWATNNTKLYTIYKPTEKLNLYTNIDYIWGLPGTEDLAEYYNANPQLTFPLSTDGSTEMFDIAVYVNAGAKYKLKKGLQLRLDIHNIGGLFDKNLNKQDLNVVDFVRQPTYVTFGFTLKL